MKRAVALVALAGLVFTLAGDARTMSATLGVDGQWVLKPGASRAAAARASFSDSAAQASNFGVLNVVTNGSFADAEQMFAAGAVEGALTWERVYEHNLNMQSWLRGAVGGNSLDPINDFFLQQLRWVRNGGCGVRGRRALTLAGSAGLTNR